MHCLSSNLDKNTSMGDKKDGLSFPRKHSAGVLWKLRSGKQSLHIEYWFCSTTTFLIALVQLHEESCAMQFTKWCYSDTYNIEGAYSLRFPRAEERPSRQHQRRLQETLFLWWHAETSMCGRKLVTWIISGFHASKLSPYTTYRLFCPSKFSVFIACSGPLSPKLCVWSA